VQCTFSLYRLYDEHRRYISNSYAVLSTFAARVDACPATSVQAGRLQPMIRRFDMPVARSSCSADPESVSSNPLDLGMVWLRATRWGVAMVKRAYPFIRNLRRHSCGNDPAPNRDLAPRLWPLSGLLETNRLQSSSRRTAMRQAEPPSSSRSSLFLIGQNSRGNWVVQDQRGVCGGLFVDRAEALRFAMFENGNRPQAVVMVPGVFELDMSRKAGTAYLPPNIDAPRKRRVA